MNKKKDYDSTIARIAGNIAAGLVQIYSPVSNQAAINRIAVQLARGIVEEVRRTS